MRPSILAIVSVVIASAAFAHSNVQNPAVQARMDGMKNIADQMKILGTMAKGERSFDAPQVADALKEIASHSSQVPALFAEPQTDPKSESRPSIWENWDDFLAKSDALTVAAGDIAVNDESDLGPALSRLGSACKSCHSDYRENKD